MWTHMTEAVEHISGMRVATEGRRRGAYLWTAEARLRAQGGSPADAAPDKAFGDKSKEAHSSKDTCQHSLCA
jgi:hypothetical protein